MKFTAFILGILLLAACANKEFPLNEKESEFSEISEVQVLEAEELTDKKDGSEELPSEAVPVFSRNDWKLILVNYQNLLPEDFEVALNRTHGYLMDHRITGAYESMYEDAKKDGIDLLLCYGYRTKEQSQQLLEKQINRQIASGLSYDDAVEEAKKWVAPPGTSEHHTGLALDIVTPAYQMLTYEFANTDAAVWMRENAHRYGFILRYPEDKEEITGITFEPWHYRYVGPEAAGYIYENGLCLEEFLKGDNVN